MMRGEINRELRPQLLGNDVCRFVSTHPDEDHFHGIELLDIRFSSEKIYYVDNDVKRRGTPMISNTTVSFAPEK